VSRAKPKSAPDRVASYVAQNGTSRLTPRQRRRVRHKAYRVIKGHVLRGGGLPADRIEAAITHPRASR
jgi:hypothetical protein